MISYSHSQIAAQISAVIEIKLSCFQTYSYAEASAQDDVTREMP